MATYEITTKETAEAILTWLTSKGGTSNLATLQALVDQKLSEYTTAYADSEKATVQTKIEYAAASTKLKADYEALIAKVDVEMAAAAVEAPPEEEPIETP